MSPLRRFFVAGLLCSLALAEGVHDAAPPPVTPPAAPATGSQPKSPASPEPAQPSGERRVFHGSLTGCQRNSSPTDYRELADKIRLQKMRVISILMVEEDGHWRPARADDRNKRCEWVFTNGRAEIVGRLFPPAGSPDQISMVWGPMCGQGRGKFMYVPGLKNPWVFVPSCSVQADRKFGAIVVVDDGKEKDGKERVRQIAIPPDPDWRRKYGFLAESGIDLLKFAGAPSYHLARWAMSMLAARQKALTADNPLAPGDTIPPPADPADGRAFCKECP